LKESHDTLGNTGRKTGFRLNEGAAPYYVFRDAGVELTLASPKGGQPPVDAPGFVTDRHLAKADGFTRPPFAHPVVIHQMRDSAAAKGT
jgi:putative intracellular protease/amidase